MTTTDLEMAFASSALGWVERKLGLTESEISQAFGVDRETIDRWRTCKSVPTPEQRRRIDKFVRLKRFLENTFRTPELGKSWLRQTVPALQGQMPISRIADGDIDGVLGVLATHAAGVYV